MFKSLQLPFTGSALVVLLMFITVFAGVLLWAFRKQSTKIYKYTSQIPLREDN